MGGGAIIISRSRVVLYRNGTSRVNTRNLIFQFGNSVLQYTIG